jgi:hypothetical protein
MLHKAIDYICHRFALIYAFGSFAFIPPMLRIIGDSFPNVNIFIQILASIGLCEIISLFMVIGAVVTLYVIEKLNDLFWHSRTHKNI